MVWERIAEGNTWTSTMTLGLYVNFWGVKVPVLHLLTSFCILSHFHSITSCSSTHSTAETSKYHQDFIHLFCNYCNFSCAWLPQQKAAYEEGTHLHLWMSNEECHWTPPSNQMRFCHYTRLTMTLFQCVVLFLHHSFLSLLPVCC